jgi:GntR family transcriptional repressor for pyruvate dehydrogenase complex
VGGGQVKSAIKQITISEQIADHLLELISRENLRPNDELPSEAELARVFNVSRPTVREATNALARQGIILKAAGKRPVVQQLSQLPFADLVTHGLVTGQTSAVDVLEARSGLEVVASGLAAEYRSDDDARALEAIVTELRKRVGDDLEFSKYDQDFHRIVIAASGNSLIQNILDGMRSAVTRSYDVGLGLVRDTKEWKNVLRFHVNIAAAIIAQDAKGAQSAMHAHFESALRRTRRAQC